MKEEEEEEKDDQQSAQDEQRVPLQLQHFRSGGIRFGLKCHSSRGRHL